MVKEEFRVIPGYDAYSVSSSGKVMSPIRGIFLTQYELNGYMIVDAFRGALTETLPVHRAVALAWVENPDVVNFNIVNHKDGNKINNNESNLEWTDHAGNNLHAINTGLRSDNIRCSVRDFYTKEILKFSSLSQAADFMKVTKAAVCLFPKQFGRLIGGRYELRPQGDHRPWFYETRTELVPPSRFMVVATNQDGSFKEIYSNRALLRNYQLYDSPGKSMLALVHFANEKYRDMSFILRDSYTEDRPIVQRATALSFKQPVMSERGIELLSFSSISECAAHFNVDRSSIQSRILSGAYLDGWKLTYL